MKKMVAVIVLIGMICFLFSTPCFAFEELSKGSKGEAVVELQKRLNELGYSVGAADGDFGSKTEKAITQFQMDHGLDVTGKLDHATNEILFQDDLSADTDTDNAIDRTQLLNIHSGVTFADTPKDVKRFESFKFNEASPNRSGGPWTLVLSFKGTFANIEDSWIHYYFDANNHLLSAKISMFGSGTSHADEAHLAYKTVYNYVKYEAAGMMDPLTIPADQFYYITGPAVQDAIEVIEYEKRQGNSGKIVNHAEWVMKERDDYIKIDLVEYSRNDAYIVKLSYLLFTEEELETAKQQANQ